MANNPRASIIGRDDALDAMFDALDSGDIVGYDGSQPANCEAALSGNVALVVLGLGAPAFAAAALGSKTANAISSDTDANATGTLSWHSLRTSLGVRRYDGTAGVGTYDLVVNQTNILIHAAFSCSSYVFALPETP